MPEAGVSARSARRYAAPWWEELDREAFQFPAARDARDRRRDGGGTPRDSRHQATSPSLPPPARTGAPSAVHGSAPPRPPRAAPARSASAVRSSSPRPALRRYERPGFQADRAAMWAVVLGIVLILVAAASAHGAVLH
ncbi:MAG: hypothetical protein JO363_13945 [Solirubrobacterales bacterium]|nr:hypothetical protein [Solirubrobacterales bacterium]